jgi:hypothetical protein
VNETLAVQFAQEIIAVNPVRSNSKEVVGGQLEKQMLDAGC